jgi:hypothetical protein
MNGSASRSHDRDDGDGCSFAILFVYERVRERERSYRTERGALKFTEEIVLFLKAFYLKVGF